MLRFLFRSTRKLGDKQVWYSENDPASNDRDHAPNDKFSQVDCQIIVIYTAAAL